MIPSPLGYKQRMRVESCWRNIQWSTRDASRVRAAFAQTFGYRKTHAVPPTSTWSFT